LDAGTSSSFPSGAENAATFSSIATGAFANSSMSAASLFFKTSSTIRDTVSSGTRLNTSILSDE